MIGARVPAHLIFKYFGGKDMSCKGDWNIIIKEALEELQEENKKLKKEIQKHVDYLTKCNKILDEGLKDYTR